MAIDPLTTSGAASALLKDSAPASTGGATAGFGETLENLLGSVNQADGAANQAVSQMLDGTGDVPEAMVAMQHADTLFQLTMQIRNKIVQAYQDVMRMTV